MSKTSIVDLNRLENQFISESLISLKNQKTNPSKLINIPAVKMKLLMRISYLFCNVASFYSQSHCYMVNFSDYLDGTRASICDHKMA